MDVTRRVHLFLYSGETDIPTMVQAAEVLSPDICYLLVHEHLDADVMAALEASAFPDARVEQIYECDHTDLYDVLGLVTTLADQDQHESDTVYLNVSTGKRPASIGAALGSMDTSTDVTAYITHTEEQEGDDDPTERLETYPIDSPTTDQVALMAIIQELTTNGTGPNKSAVIQRADDVGHSLTTDLADPTSGTDKNTAQQRLQSQLISPLGPDSKYEYVRVDSSGRSKKLTLTDSGVRALRAFRHKSLNTLQNINIDIK
ncbi:DUF6293 family protein [Halobaculum sp. MBLA0147]|uniref:HFX_2341 family transcriptional regulator domain-containing protein n=1 Tax=Halobaculum sp. MBLA0147 TaxID=3079934 RepID=UPI00352641F3